MINIFKKDVDIRLPYKYQLLFLMFSSGIFGFLVGAGLFPEWQVSVEAGQVLAGIVKYPSHIIPQYMHLIKTWTILNQISALLLHSGLSEANTSRVVAGIIGAVSFQALTVLFFSVSRNVLLSLVVPFFICYLSYVGFGVVYPILFMESPHSYGRIGLVFILLVIGLFNSGYLKTGGFLLGVAPCVHPSTGAYCILLVAIVVFLFRCERKGDFRKITLYFMYGFFITIISFLYQYSFIKDLPSLNSQEKIAYITSFIKYWDYHRIPFNYLSPGFFIALLGSIVSFIVIRFRKTDNPESLFVFRLFIVSFLLSSFLSTITYLPPEILPNLHVLMPGRYINLNNVMFMPLLLGLLTTKNNTLTDKVVFSLFILTSLGLKIFLPQTTLHIFNTTKDIQTIGKLIFMILLPLPILISTVCPGFLNKIIGDNSKIIIVLYRATVFTLLILSVVILSHVFNFSTDKLKITDPVLRVASMRKGMLLLSSEASYPIQMSIRRSTPIDPGALDGFLYAPESGPCLNNILKKIYGLNIFIPPIKVNSASRNSGTIPCIYKKLWQERDAVTWLKIRKEFGVIDILTLSDWRLNLPIVAKGGAYILYTIPDTTSQVTP
ncbi:MAG: hypothetical protein ABSF80_04735 [Chitinispirillaceae bacterium]|jgi:hypothetical protein